MRMHDKVQQVPSVIVREWEDSMNKEIHIETNISMTKMWIPYTIKWVAIMEMWNMKFITSIALKDNKKEKYMKMYYKVN